MNNNYYNYGIDWVHVEWSFYDDENVKRFVFIFCNIFIVTLISEFWLKYLDNLIIG